MINRILQKYWWLILAWLLAMFGTNFWQFNIMELIASVAIVIGAILAVRSWFGKRKRKAKRSELRSELDELIARGEWIRARLTFTTEDDYDKGDERINRWVESVRNILKDTESCRSWESDAGLPRIEHEPDLIGLAQFDDVNKKYMANRLSRLQKIRDKLGD